MIPFVPTLILGFISFISSAFVILRIVIPILPPHPLSRRVPPSEFGLPNYNFRSLSSADKSHLWLASLDILALVTFIWQAFNEYYGGPTAYGDTRDAASSARLWFALTIRQTCLLVVSALTLIHIRMGRSVSFGYKHWILWAPTFLLALTSTVLCGVLAGAGIPSLFVGLLAYSITVALLSSAAFGSLVYTLVVIRRNLAALNEPADSWPPLKEVEDKPRPSFATEDIDALREGSSWLTSDASSTHHDSVSNWSFSTLQTLPRSGSLHINSATASKTSLLPPKSSYWFNPATPAANDSLIPPVPPLPSPYRESPSPTCALGSDPDPFRRDVPSRPRLGSQSSWLTSQSGSQVTLSAWSFPTTHQGGVSVVDLNAELLQNVSRPQTPALSTARVLGGYGCQGDSEKGIASLAYNGGDVDISLYRYACWMMTIWVPLALSLPYFLSFVGKGFVSPATPHFLILSVTLSSPLLAMNIIMRSPIPIPTGLFDIHDEPPSVCLRAPSPTSTLGDYNREYKRSGSVTVVEERRSGDVWISHGDAVDGKSKLSRAFGLVAPVPRLAVLPPDEELEDGQMTPPLPMQTGAESFNTSVFPNTPQSAEFGRLRKESVHSSISQEEFASRIMVAQRHYSALATTVVVPASPEKQDGDLLTVTSGTGVETRNSVAASSSHIRCRSLSSVIGQAISGDCSPTPPPSEPLPPTPPNVRLAKQQSMRTLIHRKSYSSGFSFGAVVNDDVNEIDALTAGVLPLLVPGLKVGNDMRIKDFDFETSSRRNTLWGDESRSISTRNLGLRVDVPHGMDSTRTSTVTLLDPASLLPPPSAASTITLFDAMADFEPSAQSTPHDAKKEYAYSRKYQSTGTRSSRPTSYERNNNDENTPAQWSTPGVVKPLIPKSDKRRKDASESLRPLSLLKDRNLNRNSNGDVASHGLKSDKRRKESADFAKKSNSNSLRPLSLLKDRNLNRNNTGTVNTGHGIAGTRPLALGHKMSKTPHGILRKDETIPSLFVRPPSDRMESIYEIR